MGLGDLVVVLVPMLIAVIVYVFACGTKKRSSTVATKGERDVSLSKLPIVTITANHVLLDDNLEMNRSTSAALELLTKRACVFVFVVVKDMEEQERIKDQINKQFEGLIDEDNILYCQTPMGRASMSRQLSAVSHIDYDPEVIHQIAIFYKAVLIAPRNVESPHAAWRCESFSEFMTNGNTEFLELLHK